MASDYKESLNKMKMKPFRIELTFTKSMMRSVLDSAANGQCVQDNGMFNLI